MSSQEIEMTDLNIKSITPMPTPGDLMREFPLDPEVFKAVVGPARQTIRRILTGEDRRLLAIVGPCSIHSPEEAFEYAEKLSEFAPKVSDQIFIVMRACLDKPRTGRGWAGFFQDPDLNESRNIGQGWRKGRELLVQILTETGLPVGMELLDADACQNISDAMSYWWIGARTVTSQRLREIASGLSTPVGFKNPTNGRIEDAIEAMDTAWHDSAFIAINENGQRSEYRTRGNKNSHLILRGSEHGPNFSSQHVTEAVAKLSARSMPTRLLIDVSHANSGKIHTKQGDIIIDIAKRVSAGERNIVGFLYESYLEAGNQKLPKDLSKLKPRISITDGCDDIETTKRVLKEARDILAKRRK